MQPNHKCKHSFSSKNIKNKCFKMSSAAVVTGSLMLSTLVKIFSNRHIEIFPYCSKKTGYVISCKCLILFSWKNKKNIISLSSAEFAQRVVKVKD